jgi:hypothetical protein
VLPSYFGRVASKDGRCGTSRPGSSSTPREGDDFYLDHPEAGTSSTPDAATRPNT